MREGLPNHVERGPVPHFGDAPDEVDHHRAQLFRRLPGTRALARIEVVGKAVRMRKLRRAGGTGRRGKSIVERLRGRGSVRMTTDEILALTRGDR